MDCTYDIFIQTLSSGVFYNYTKLADLAFFVLLRSEEQNKLAKS